MFLSAVEKKKKKTVFFVIRMWNRIKYLQEDVYMMTGISHILLPYLEPYSIKIEVSLLLNRVESKA